MHHIRVPYPITGDINLDHLVKVVSTVFVVSIVILFPFVNNKYLRSNILRLCKYPFSP